MADIKVITEVGPKDITTLSQDERDILFEQIASENMNIPRVHIDAFSAMLTRSIKDAVRYIRPGLRELLLRKIIQISISHGISERFNTVVIPIVAAVNADKHTGARVGTNRSDRGGRFKRTGAAQDNQALHASSQRPRNAKSDLRAIKVQFDTQVLAVTTRGLNYVPAPNEELIVVGIILNPVHTPPHTLERGRSVARGEGDMRLLTAVEPRINMLESRLYTGNYTATDLISEHVREYFIVPELKFARGSVSEFIESQGVYRLMFDDLDDAHIYTALSSVYDYLVGIEHVQQGPALARGVMGQISAAVKTNGGSPLIMPKLAAIVARAPAVPRDYSTPEMERPPILDILESIHYGVFYNAFHMSVLAAIDTRGFWRIYQWAMLNGKDDKRVTDEIHAHKERNSRIRFQLSVAEKQLDERNKANTYKMIIERKLGSVRLSEVEHQLRIQPSLAAARVVDILDLLKGPERKIIELEYKRREGYLEAVINNKCPHVKLYGHFRRASSDAQIGHMFNDLKAFFKNPDASESMITCINCGFDIMCPHVREFTTLELAGRFYAEIKAKMAKYIDRAISRDQYYCKICGEMISSGETYEEGSGIDSTSMMNEELREFMWSEIAILSKSLKFGNMVNVPKLIGATRDICYPFIFEIEKQILKSKTNSMDEIKAKKRLYVTIYAFAYFIHLVLGHTSGKGDNDISFRNHATGDAKNAIVGLVKHALDTILTMRNVAIREIPGMSPDIIKQTLITAYKSMQATRTVPTASRVDEDKALLMSVVSDPIYLYYYNINVVADAIGGQLDGKNRVPGPSKKFDMIDRLDHVLGGPLKAVAKAGHIYDKARVPTFKGWREDTFLQLKPMKEGRVALSPGKLVYDDAFSGYCASSFKLFLSMMSVHAWSEPLYMDSGIKSSDPAAVVDPKLRPIHETLRKKHADFEVRETRLMDYKTMAYAQGYTFLPATHTRRWGYIDMPLSSIYDEEGGIHKWNIYIVSEGPVRGGRGGDGDGDKDGVGPGAKLPTGNEVPPSNRKEYTAKDVVALLDKGVRFTGRIIDHKCSICGILRSVVGTLSVPKILDSLHARQRVANFYRFYESRCPRGGLHEFNAAECSKCGITSAFLMNTVAPASINYYREHKDTYTHERAEFASAVAQSIASTEEAVVVEQDNTSFIEEYASWSANFNIILNLSNRLKVNHRLLSALGATEKQEYSDISSGAYIPSEVEDKNSTRALAIDSHITNLITEYNQLRFFNKLIRPPMDLSAIIDASGINKHKIAELSGLLPAIFNNYTARFAYFRQHKKAREIVAFCIQSFCEMCLKLLDDTNKETERLRRNFVEHIVKKTLRNEELLTKPGYFNWSLLYGDKDTKEKDSADPNTEMADTSGPGDDDADDEKEDEDYGDTAAPMTAADFDIDVDPDADPEDTDQDWKVGDDLGL